MIILIDNFDSFTYNLYQMVASLGKNITVMRNDVTLGAIIEKQPTKLIISPGPGKPNDAGISMAAIKHFSDKIPILGVCLGHQAITEVFGGKVVKASKIVHGKVHSIQHSGKHIFQGIQNPIEVTRYHSLIAEKHSLPECLEITAYLEENSEEVIMALKHRQHPIFGVQFHPESIATKKGELMLQNFLKMS